MAMYRAWRSRLAQAAHELCQLHAEPGRELQRVVQAEVAPAALDLADEGPVKAATASQTLLTEAQRPASRAHALTEHARGVRSRLRHQMTTPSLYPRGRPMMRISLQNDIWQPIAAGVVSSARPEGVSRRAREARGWAGCRSARFARDRPGASCG